MTIIKVKKLFEDAFIPKFAHEGDAAVDLVARENYLVAPMGSSLVSTGLSIEIPEGYYVSVVPRSGISLKTPLRVANTPGTIDSGYRGEIKVIMTNTMQQIYNMKIKRNLDDSASESFITEPNMILSDKLFGLDLKRYNVSDLGEKFKDKLVPYGTFIIQRGDRIAQMILRKCEKMDFEIVDTLNDSERGENGFGSSGVK